MTNVEKAKMRAELKRQIRNGEVKTSNKILRIEAGRVWHWFDWIWNWRYRRFVERKRKYKFRWFFWRKHKTKRKR